MPESNVYRFADLVLDVQNRRLTRRGVEIYLAPKTFETLVVLVQRHGQVVSKATLLDAVWNETAVTDNALTQQISELREVLQDDARQPRFIRTRPRVGFTFIAPVEPVPPGIGLTDPPSFTVPSQEHTESPAAAPPGRAADARSRTVSSRWAALVAVGLVVAAGLARLGVGRTHALSQLELVSSLAGLHRSPSLSPDGRTVAFLSDRSGTPQVWVKNLRGGDSLQITFHDRAASRPRWSAQGDQIVYSVQGMGVWSVAPLGGSARRLLETGRNPDISPDGRLLVFERPWEVWTANIDGTNQRRLPALKHGYLAYYGDAWPTFSPDGKQIAVFLAKEGPYGDYWLVPTEGGEPRRLTNDDAEGGPPAWTPDGKYIVVSSARAGSVTLWRVPVAGGTPEALTAGAGDDLDPVISADGRRVVFANVKRSWSLVIHDTISGIRRTVIETRTSLGSPRFSSDGRRLAFHGKDEAGDTHVFVADVDGANVRSLTTGRRELNIMPHWGHLDRALVYYQVSPRQTLRRIPVTGGPFENIADWRWDREHEASTDPSSERIVYSILEKGRLRETRVRALDGASETTLAIAMFEPQFSRDGRRIAGESRDQTVTVCELPGECRAITPRLDRGLASIGWSADGTRLFYLQRTERPGWGELKSIGVDGSSLRTHATVGPLRPYDMSIGVSPRDEIAYAPYREGPHELWMAELR